MNTINELDDNRDPISGEPGSHPIGTGLGAAAGGATGAAVGVVGGPVGVAVGAVVGAVVGGLAGKAAGEAVNPTAEDAFWRDQYRNEPYYNVARPYEHYAPAYRTGYEGRAQYREQRFEDVQADLQRNYDVHRGDSGLSWEEAKPATRAAWDRLERAIPGDSDRDGK